MPRKRYSEGTLDQIGSGKDRRWRGYWFVYVMVDGREIRRKREKIIGPATMPKHEARAELMRHIQESRGELPPPPENPTVEQLWERYRLHKSGSWSKATADTLVSLFAGERGILQPVASTEISEITVGPLQQILNRMAAAGRSESAISKARTHLKAMLEFAVDERLLNINPARGKKLTAPKKGVPKPSGRFLDIAESRALLSSAAGREHLIIRLLLVAGLRSQELFLLRANDIEPGQVRVDEAFKRSESGSARIGGTKTAGAAVPDCVPVPPDLEKELRDWIRTQAIASDGLLFPNSHGGLLDPSNYLDRVLKPLAISAGVGVRDAGARNEDGSPVLTSDLTYQALRRTCATFFRRDLKGAQRQLRHASPHVTAKHYQQSITAEHRVSVEALDRELCGAAEKVATLKRRA